MATSAGQELLAEENYVRAEIEAAHRAAQRLEARLTKMQRDFLKQADESRNIALVAYREGAMDLYKLLETHRVMTRPATSNRSNFVVRLWPS